MNARRKMGFDIDQKATRAPEEASSKFAKPANRNAGKPEQDDDANATANAMWVQLCDAPAAFPQYQQFYPQQMLHNRCNKCSKDKACHHTCSKERYSNHKEYRQCHEEHNWPPNRATQLEEDRGDKLKGPIDGGTIMAQQRDAGTS